MSFVPQCTVSARLLRELEAIADLKAKIVAATIQVAWTPQLAKDSRQRGAHASTAIEGNPLTLEEVRALDGGAMLPVHAERSQREVRNYLASLRWIEKRAKQAKPVTHEDLFRLHRLLADGVMDQGDAGRYRTSAVKPCRLGGRTHQRVLVGQRGAGAPFAMPKREPGYCSPRPRVPATPVP